MSPIIDFAKVPSDTALALAKTTITRVLAEDTAQALGLEHVQVQILHDVMIGSVAQGIDDFMKF